MRYYDINGEKFPSVTSVTNMIPKPFLDKWRKDTPDWKEITEKSATIGIIMHYRIGCYLAERFEKPMPELKLDNKPKMTPELMEKINTMWAQFEEMFAEYVFVPHLIEETLVNYDPQYAGRVDLVALMGDDIWVLDFKTGKSVYDEHGAQLAAYAKCKIPGYKMYPDPIKGAIIRLNAETGWEFKEMDMVVGWNMFMDAYGKYKEAKARCKGDCKTCELDVDKCKIRPTEVVQ